MSSSCDLPTCSRTVYVKPGFWCHIKYAQSGKQAVSRLAQSCHMRGAHGRGTPGLPAAHLGAYDCNRNLVRCGDHSTCINECASPLVSPRQHTLSFSVQTCGTVAFCRTSAMRRTGLMSCHVAVVAYTTSPSPNFVVVRAVANGFDSSPFLF